MKRQFCFLVSALVAVMASITSAVVVDYNDLVPGDNTVSNSFWDCRAHVCKVEQVVSSELELEIVKGPAKAAPSKLFDLETRTFARETGEFVLTTKPSGFLILVR